MDESDYIQPLSLLFECTTCQQLYQLYIPNRVQAKAVNLGPEEIAYATKLDKELKETGKVENVKRMAKRIGAKFVDASVNEIVQCDCGEVFDLLVYYKKGGHIGCGLLRGPNLREFFEKRKIQRGPGSK